VVLPVKQGLKPIGWKLIQRIWDAVEVVLPVKQGLKPISSFVSPFMDAKLKWYFQ